MAEVKSVLELRRLQVVLEHVRSLAMPPPDVVIAGYFCSYSCFLQKLYGKFAHSLIEEWATTAGRLDQRLLKAEGWIQMHPHGVGFLALR